MSKRIDIQFDSQGTLCRGWFYPPEKGPAPCVLLAHGFGAIKENRLDAYAERFAEAGYCALVFDYRHFGSSGGSPRQILDIKKQHRDWHAALAFARTLPEVDSRKIVLWGSSFSGGHVIEVAVKDKDIAAVISQVPHLSGPASAMAAGLKQNIRLGIASARDLLRAAAGREPFYVPIVNLPGLQGAITAPGAYEGVMALFPPGIEPDNRVAARIFMSFPVYSPGRLAAKLKMPWLIQVALKDTTTPPGPAIKAAKRGPRAELLMYDIGHFDAYVDPHFQSVVSDQIEFLKRHL